MSDKIPINYGTGPYVISPMVKKLQLLPLQYKAVSIVFPVPLMELISLTFI